MCRQYMRLGLELLALLVQIYSLLTQLERRSPRAEAFELHAEHLGVKIDATVQVCSREDDVINVVNLPGFFRFYFTAPTR
jgi:hypothetical protein